MRGWERSGWTAAWSLPRGMSDAHGGTTAVGETFHLPLPRGLDSRNDAKVAGRWRAVRTILSSVSGGWYPDRKSTRLNSSHSQISYAVFCLKKKSLHLSPRLQKHSLPSFLSSLFMHKPPATIRSMSYASWIRYQNPISNRLLRLNSSVTQA